MFEKLKLSDKIVKALRAKGFVTPTEVQLRCIPKILEGRDIFGRSKTGTGKTFAFGLPAIQLVDTKISEVQILIVCPTRELAAQVAEEIRKATLYTESVAIACVYGGANINTQITALKTAKIVVGTPGRIMDHIRRRTLKLAKVKLVVLDEADVMLNMGFREDIEKILKNTPKSRQTVMFSATMPPSIKAITKMYLKEPEYIEIGEANATLKEIKQTYVTIKYKKKRKAMLELYENLKPQNSIVFCNTKRMADLLALYLTNNQVKPLLLHGDMKQAERKRTLDAFKKQKSDILIASDVAARGLDILDIDYIFNFDLPQDCEQYIHRIGRTGRAGKEGNALTIINSSDELIALKRYAITTKSKINEHKINTKLSSYEEIQGEIPPERSVLHGSTYKSKSGKYIPFSGRTRW